MNRIARNLRLLEFSVLWWWFCFLLGFFVFVFFWKICYIPLDWINDYWLWFLQKKCIKCRPCLNRRGASFNVSDVSFLLVKQLTLRLFIFFFKFSILHNKLYRRFCLDNVGVQQLFFPSQYRISCICSFVLILCHLVCMWGNHF